uniref:Uncharacterized protein n=1 Tax=Schistosoma japonicum TaxID=6182 RepID=C7TYT4_SCHJA|nr:hypothetical protein [Schistosoma japonicum]
MKIALALLFILQLHSIQLQLISGSKVSADSNSRSKGNNIETKNNGKSMSKPLMIHIKVKNLNKKNKTRKESQSQFDQILKSINQVIKQINTSIVCSDIMELVETISYVNDILTNMTNDKKYLKKQNEAFQKVLHILDTVCNLKHSLEVPLDMLNPSQSLFDQILKIINQVIKQINTSIVCSDIMELVETISYVNDILTNMTNDKKYLKKQNEAFQISLTFEKVLHILDTVCNLKHSLEVALDMLNL